MFYMYSVFDLFYDETVLAPSYAEEQRTNALIVSAMALVQLLGGTDPSVE